MDQLEQESGLGDPGDLFQPRWFWDSLTWPQPPCTAERSLSVSSLRYSKPNQMQSCSSDAASSSGLDLGDLQGCSLVLLWLCDPTAPQHPDGKQDSPPSTLVVPPSTPRCLFTPGLTPWPSAARYHNSKRELDAWAGTGTL